MSHSPCSKRHKGDSGIQIETGDSIIVVGKGRLRVSHGTVLVHGYSLHGPRGTLELDCDAHFPMCISSQDHNDAQVPYVAAGYATVSLNDVEEDERGTAVPEHHGDDSTTAGPSLRVVEVHNAKAFHPQEWKDVAYTIASSISDAMAAGVVGHPPVICVCGGKNTGKSSFCRYLVNTLLNYNSSVDYLDMDCGQTEFTPPGLVSLCEIRQPLVGPPYYDRRGSIASKMSHFIGDTSPSSDPDVYIKYILNLYMISQKQSRVTGTMRPLVVNTYGWIQGLGLDVLGACFDRMDVTHAVRIQSDKERNNVSEEFFAAKEGANVEALQYTIPALSSAAAPSAVAARQVHQDILAAEAVTGRHGSNYHAVERRNMQWNSFAMQCCSGTDTAVESRGRDIGTRLAFQLPYVVPLDSLHVSCTHSIIRKEQLMRVLNGSVVGLCIQNSKKKQTAVMECVGLGIVRSVNVATRMLYILTSVHDQTVLQSVNHVVIGRLDLPPHLLQTDQFKSPYLALHAMTAEGTAAGSGKSRNNLLRSSQI